MTLSTKGGADVEPTAPQLDAAPQADDLPPRVEAALQVSVAAGEEISPDESALTVRDLRKSYKDLNAVDGISFTVKRGEIFGILGPNGAGKTTTLEMIEGLRRPDAGEILVEGTLSWPDPRKVKPLIGVQLQSTALFDYLTVRETVELFASFYGLFPHKQDVAALLDRVGLAQKQKNRTRELSGGQQQRLSIALALVNHPRVLFLDEPTTGLDPQARRRLWRVVRDINRSGMTVILTTHYMEEAQVLCSRLAVMDHGHIIALGSPGELIKAGEMSATIAFTSTPAFPEEVLESIRTVDKVVRPEMPAAAAGEPDAAERYLLTTTDVEGTLFRVVGRARHLGVHITDLEVHSPTLEDVFLALTGHSLRN